MDGTIGNDEVGIPDSATRQPARLEYLFFFLFVLMFIPFGGIVELRSAFLSRRMGDLGCYLRPAWAAVVGESIYDVAEDNGWHYNYPPLYVILLRPLADPPPSYDHAGYVPWAVSVAIIYVLNIACLVLAVHVLASAMQRHSSDPAFRDQPRYCRRWWAMRLWPVLACLPGICHSAMRGQVNLQVLLLFCGWLACELGGRRRLGGFVLAIAISIKVIPGYLLVYPLWRRDGRTIFGCALGLIVGLVLVPLLAMGPTRTVSEYTRYGEVLFGPLFKLTDDESRKAELLGMDATDSMGIKHAIHCWMHPDGLNRPPAYTPGEEWFNRTLGVLMTLAILWPVRKLSQANAWQTVHDVGLLILLMIAFSPVSHVHYFAFCLPLVMSLLVRRWQYGKTLGVGWPIALALVWFVVAVGLPSWPGLEWLKDKRLPLLGALPLWVFGVLDRWRAGAAQQATASAPPSRMAA